MSARLVAIGLSHRTAPVRLREKATLDPDGVRCLLRLLISDPQVAEAAAISTCNRTEVYVVGEDAERGKAAVERALASCTRISAAELACAHYALYDEHAAGHLFRVAGGMDSMVLGESEVQGQVRAAAMLAREEETLGELLDGLFQRALAAGRRVRQQTRIANGPTSLSSVAADVASRALPHLAERRVLLVGAGRMAESTGRALVRQGARKIVVASRTLQSARALAVCLGGRAVRLDAVQAELERADLVVCSTDAPHAVLRRDEVARAVATRAGRTLALIDLAVPRDVEPEVGALPGVLLHDIDDLERGMRDGVDGRRRELARAEAIVADEVARFGSWRNGLAVAPTVEALHLRADELRRAELARASRKLDGRELQLFDELTRSLVTKLLHEPSVRLREEGSLRHAGSLRHLFALDEPPAGEVVELRAAS
ncbi:MAG TPA: glutamyl-tRNA reductase [Thermoleophilaceae bacterium]|nr:glutamyl-tRNA reductase [Thermoleophilaceae bacterium]